MNDGFVRTPEKHITDGRKIEHKGVTYYVIKRDQKIEVMLFSKHIENLYNTPAIVVD